VPRLNSHSNPSSTGESSAAKKVPRICPFMQRGRREREILS